MSTQGVDSSGAESRDSSASDPVRKRVRRVLTTQEKQSILTLRSQGLTEKDVCAHMKVSSFVLKRERDADPEFASMWKKLGLHAGDRPSAREKQTFLNVWRDTRDERKAAKLCGRSVGSFQREKDRDEEFRLQCDDVDSEIAAEILAVAHTVGVKGQEYKKFDRNGNLLESGVVRDTKVLMKLMEGFIPKRFARNPTDSNSSRVIVNIDLGSTVASQHVEGRFTGAGMPQGAVPMGFAVAEEAEFREMLGVANGGPETDMSPAVRDTLAAEKAEEVEKEKEKAEEKVALLPFDFELR